MRFGTFEIILVVLIIVLLFGARRIPELMRGLGRGVKEFKDGMHEGEDKNKPEKKDGGSINP
jgi:sec-independent protein translocase protein TatA